MAIEYVNDSANARYQAVQRFRADDPVTYTTPKNKRIDAKFTVMGLANEVTAMVDMDANDRVVRVKNTSGGSWAAGTLLYPDDVKLTAQTTATAVNNPSAGANVVIQVAATFEVGQVVKIESGGKTDYAIVTAVSGGASVTVDLLLYSHTLPTVTALPAYEASKADADGAKPAEWVTASAIADGAYGYAYASKVVTGLDTSALTVEKLLYLSDTAGTYTQTAPTGSDKIQQVVGIVKKVHASTGEIIFIPGMKRILKYGSSFTSPSPLTTKGDLYTRDGSADARLAVGTDAQILMADAAATNGIKWISLGTDLTVALTGAVTIANSAITTVKINAEAVTMAKIQRQTSGHILIGQGAGADVAFTAVTGDVTITNGGVTAIGASKVLTTMIADSNVTTVKIADLNVTTAKIADANVTLAKLESRARPAVNYLINAGFPVFQWTAGASTDISASGSGVPAGGDGLYSNCPDRWYALLNTSGVNYPSTSRVAGDASGSYYSQYALNYATPSSLSGRGGVAQIVESFNVYPLRGKTVRFQCRVANDVASKAMRCAIIATTSTVAAVDTFTSTTRDVVNDWTSTTYTQNNFFKSNASGYYVVGTGNVTPSGTITAYSDLSCTGTVPTDAQNLICMVFIEDALGNSKNFRLTQCGLYDGVEARDWFEPPIDEVWRQCYRYLYIPGFKADNTFVSGANSPNMIAVGATTSASNASVFLPFPATLRTTPTLTVTAAHWIAVDGVTNSATSSVSVSLFMGNAVRLDCGISGAGAGRGCFIAADATGGRRMSFSAEI